MSRRSRKADWLSAVSYGVLACLLTWPLPLHFQTHTLGDVSEDTGVYLWNLWIFRHELLTHHRLPVSTDHVLAYTGGSPFGVVGAFNIVLIALIALAGLGVFILARRTGLGGWPAWAAGALFIASPVLMARATAHASLVNAAPLPFFLAALLHTLETRRVRHTVLVGILVALAYYADAYYGIYCAIMGAFVVAWRLAHVDGPAAARERLRTFLRLGLVSLGVCLALMLPVLVAFALHFPSDRLPDTAIGWRSDMRGVDALAYFVPNPNHAWFGARTVRWFMPDVPYAFPEFVGAFSLVALAVIALGAWRRALPSFWIAFTAFFVWLSFGPSTYVGGGNTHIPGPWTILRNLPVIGMARVPSRFAVVAAMGLSVLFGFALQAFYRRCSARPWLTASLVAALAIELVPAPRPLYSAAIPDAYRMIAATPESRGRVMELPTGIRDGMFAFGRFNPATMYFQTAHQHPIVGGYLSRVWLSQREKVLGDPMLHALFALGTGAALTPGEIDAARRSREPFLRRACLQFVLFDTRRITAPLRAFAIDALALSPVREDEDYALLEPRSPPACESR